MSAAVTVALFAFVAKARWYLEKRTGLNFGDLKKFDHFAKTGEAGTIESISGIPGGGVKENAIREPSDIVI